MRARKFAWKRDRRGISGAVTAVMLLLIISSVVSIMMIVFVPVWGESDETQHMRVTLEQFYSLRENIDAQVLRDSPVAAAAPSTCAAMKPGASAGRRPAKVSVAARASVTAGLANEVEAVNQ